MSKNIGNEMKIGVWYIWYCTSNHFVERNIDDFDVYHISSNWNVTYIDKTVWCISRDVWWRIGGAEWNVYPWSKNNTKAI